MNLDQALRLLGMLTDTVAAQQAQIDQLTRVNGTLVEELNAARPTETSDPEAAVE